LRESPIQIGSISLQGFEIPQSVRFGGRHRLAVHNLSGGRRVLERLGPDDGEIAFQGIFSGRNAEARVRAFDDLRLSGEIVWLTWETFKRRVVVKSFVAEYHSPWWIPYKVSCVVAYQSGVASGNSTVTALISSDLGNALAAIAGSAVALTLVQSALSSTNAMTTGTTNNGQAVAAVGTTLDVINGQIGQQSAVVTAPLEPNVGSASLCQTLTSMVSSAGLLAAAVNARSYVGRIGRTLNGARI
jgi:hypothetical protein